MKRIIYAAAILVAMVTIGGNSAEARSKHRYRGHDAHALVHGHVGVHHREGRRAHRKRRVTVAPVMEPCFIFCPVAPFTRKKGVSGDAPFGMKRASFTDGGARSTFVRGRLICAINVVRELRARGYNPPNTARAKDLLHYGSASSGNPGDVAIFSRGKRGGHAAIVAGFGPNGERLYLNPSSRRQAWQIGPYHRTPIAFRSPT